MKRKAKNAAQPQKPSFPNPKWEQPNPSVAYPDLHQELMYECSRVFEPLERIRREEAQPGQLPLNAASWLSDPDDNVLFHIIFALSTKRIAEQMPDFHALRLLHSTIGEMFMEYLTEFHGLPDTLYNCNLGFDTLLYAMDQYAEEHGCYPMAFLDLELVLQALPDYYLQTIDADLCNDLLNSMELHWDYIEFPGLKSLLPTLYEELERIAKELSDMEE